MTPEGMHEIGIEAIVCRTIPAHTFLKHENKTPASVSFSIQFKTEEIQEPTE